MKQWIKETMEKGCLIPWVLHSEGYLRVGDIWAWNKRGWEGVQVKVGMGDCSSGPSFSFEGVRVGFAWNKRGVCKWRVHGRPFCCCRGEKTASDKKQVSQHNTTNDRLHGNKVVQQHKATLGGLKPTVKTMIHVPIPNIGSICGICFSQMYFDVIN